MNRVMLDEALDVSLNATATVRRDLVLRNLSNVTAMIRDMVYFALHEEQEKR
jgi:hypothetical protein